MHIRFASLVATSAALAAAQSSSSSGGTATTSAAVPASTAAIPSCALSCTLSSLSGTPCESYGVSNLTCICTSTQFQLAFYNCQQTTCAPADLAAAEAYGAQACEQNGTPIDIQAVPSGFSSSASASTAGSPTANQTSSSVGSTAAPSTSASLASTATGSVPSASGTGSDSGGGSSGASPSFGRNVFAGSAALLAGAVAVVVGAW
ncbi:hypothetical protein JCM10213_000106 [Rhodosporidiobolus nylandii]